MKKTTAITTAALAAALTLGASTAPGSSSGTKVNVALKEFKMSPLPANARAGKVTFVAKNVGKFGHEMVVVKTNLPPSKLPMKNGRVSERGSVGEIGGIAPGQTKTKTLTLAAGRYVLLCNLKGHYASGQYAGFVVK